MDASCDVRAVHVSQADASTGTGQAGMAKPAASEAVSDEVAALKSKLEEARAKVGTRIVRTHSRARGERE